MSRKLMAVVVALLFVVACGGVSPTSVDVTEPVAVAETGGDVEMSAARPGDQCSLSVTKLSTDQVQAYGSWTGNGRGTKGFLTKVGSTDRIVPVTTPFNKTVLLYNNSRTWTISLTVIKNNGTVLCTKVVGPYSR